MGSARRQDYEEECVQLITANWLPGCKGAGDATDKDTKRQSTRQRATSMSIYEFILAVKRPAGIQGIG